MKRESPGTVTGLAPQAQEGIVASHRDEEFQRVVRYATITSMINAPGID
jgi:hypothetical protein